jgi:hypothetical protein
MVSRISVVCSIALALVFAGPIQSVSAASLLPYGTEQGDTLADQDATSVITLTEGFTFLGDSFTVIRVSAGLSFLIRALGSARVGQCGENPLFLHCL